MSGPQRTANGELVELTDWGRGELLRAGIEEAREECERILMKLLDRPRSGLYLDECELLGPGVREQFRAIVTQRIRRIPLAYLLKEVYFGREVLYVDERCLIPRPETEILVEQVLKAFKGRSGINFSFLDIGTGSGAIAVALLREFPGACGALLDISRGALDVARINIEKYGLQDRAMLVHGDIFNLLGARDSSATKLWTDPSSGGGLGACAEALRPAASFEGPVPVFDMIVSNPPYLSEKDWEGVQEELKFEPREALDGGKDGLDYYRKILAGAKRHLNPGGLLALEVGQDQAPVVSKWLHEAGYANIHRFRDYLGIERVILAQYRGKVTGNE